MARPILTVTRLYTLSLAVWQILSRSSWVTASTGRTTWGRVMALQRFLLGASISSWSQSSKINPRWRWVFLKSMSFTCLCLQSKLKGHPSALLYMLQLQRLYFHTLISIGCPNSGSHLSPISSGLQQNTLHGGGHTKTHIQGLFSLPSSRRIRVDKTTKGYKSLWMWINSCIYQSHGKTIGKGSLLLFPAYGFLLEGSSLCLKRRLWPDAVWMLCQKLSLPF